MEQDVKKLFQITEAARACGLSRSTLLRLEEKGLLTPAYIAPDSGRRYYDNHNVARILQIEKLKAMGLGTEEIVGYFARGGDAAELLATMENRLRELSRGVEELRLRAEQREGFSVQLMTLPAVTCCMRRCEGHTVAEKYAAMYDFYGECVRKGYRLSDEPLFSVLERTDYLDGFISQTPYPFWVCAPVRPEKAPAEAVTLPACRVLSVLYYGDYAGLDEAWLTLGREVKARGLKPAGLPRGLGIVAPYTGREIETKRYCSRVVLPVEE
ncbi:MerR family transcriptional regulator [Gemmiger sp.]